MKIYAKVRDGLVVNVIVADTEFFKTFVDDSPGTYIETKIDGSIRKNYAGIGFSYDSIRDAFIPPQPYSSWTLNEETCLWQCPVAYPDDGNIYTWDESQQNWVREE